MKPIKLHPDEYVTLATGTELQEVPEYATKDQLRRRDGSSSWYWRKRLPDDPHKRFTGTPDKDESHRLINRDYHLVVQGEKLKVQRITSPTLAQIAVAYANAKISYIDALGETRRNNLHALKKVTRHLATGDDPTFKKADDSMIKVVSTGFWDKIRVSQLTEDVAKDFQANYVAGLDPESKEYQLRGAGANDYLRQAKGVFRKEAVSLFSKMFKMPDVSGFHSTAPLKVQKDAWEAPPNEFLAKFYRDLPQLEKDDPDAFAMFILSYGAGLSRSEAINAKYSWMRPEEVSDLDLTVSTHWFVKVQPNDDYRPKNTNRCRKAEISESLFQKLLDLRYVFREERADRLKKITLSDEELAKAVWSKPITLVADDLDVSDYCVTKTCKRRGIPRPTGGFWAKVKAGSQEHPNGQMPEAQAEQFRQRDRVPTSVRNDDYIIQRGRNTGKSGAPARLAKWFRNRGWNRKQVTHELRKIHVSLYLLETGDMYAASKQAGHGSYRTTERFYAGQVRRHKVNIELPTG